jgi:phospholipase/carboxylesterase
MPARVLPFVHRFYVPDAPDGSVLVLLHGTGGNEADLMPLGHRVNPRATLLGVRGRSTEDGTLRWFRRHKDGQFDQDDIRSEAEAFAAFVSDATSGYGLDATRLIFLGYSNGANLLGAVLRLHPGVVRCAILLRAMEVLETRIEAKSPDTHVLIVTGANDPFADGAGRLAQALRATDANVATRVTEAGHELVAQDEVAIRDWLAKEQAQPQGGSD